MFRQPFLPDHTHQCREGPGVAKEPSLRDHDRFDQFLQFLFEGGHLLPVDLHVLEAPRGEAFAHGTLHAGDADRLGVEAHLLLQQRGDSGVEQALSSAWRNRTLLTAGGSSFCTSIHRNNRPPSCATGPRQGAAALASLKSIKLPASRRIISVACSAISPSKCSP